MILSRKKLHSFKKRSDAAISVFRRTITDLATVNTQIREEEEHIQKQIETLTNQNKDLVTQRQENEKFIGNIEKFLNGDLNT